ncbi:hypothetical protein AV530_009739 [Patagioenas fasciata monilis]|uniref:Uncharacterized protein n=1 Tax=Patagioenas fasciata monilis TaxID=372326 RepID=A0A1V4KTP1_PATFA|nr:hypothetical protein AV530_009739 [Patagioenas fasciata monilis]
MRPRVSQQPFSLTHIPIADGGVLCGIRFVEGPGEVGQLHEGGEAGGDRALCVRVDYTHTRTTPLLSHEAVAGQLRPRPS